MNNKTIWRLLEALNWNHGRGELVAFYRIPKISGGVAISQCQFGFSTFRFKIKGNTVFARKHQKTYKSK